MKSVRIFFRDWKTIATNWVAAVLIGGLIFLPSLYAWLNIEASWDPYGQTDQLPIGVVNEDKGGTIRDRDIDVGSEVVESLKNNDNLDWHFTNRSKALDRLEYGDYYAVVIIPENFSAQLATVLNDEPKKAEIEYYVNEKVNAISPKITEKGASAIVEQITGEFISEVNGTIFCLFNEIGVTLEKDQSDIERFEGYVFQLEERLPEINRLVSDAYDESKDGQALLNKAGQMLPKATEVVGGSLHTIDETTKLLQAAEERLNQLAPKVEADLKRAQQIAHDINEFTSGLQGKDIDMSTGQELAKRLDDRVQESIERIGAVEAAIKQLQEQNGEQQEEGEANNESSDQLNQALNDLQSLKTALQLIQTESNDIKGFLTDKQTVIDQFITNLNEKSKQTATQIDAFLKEYHETIEPRVLAEVSSAKKTMADARALLVEAQKTIPAVDKLISNTKGTLSEGQTLLVDVLNEYPYVNAKVNELADRIREFQKDADLRSIIDLLKNDPGAEKGFFAEPVVLNKNSVFPIENYGTGMTPFYTVLSLWVGALLLVSLLTTEVHHHEDYTETQIYYGKLLTFVSIGLAQTLIVTIGDIFILKVNIVHPLQFVLFGLLISAVFMTIVYTLVSVLGNVGKAVAIVFLVLQIAGSGGTYPIALLPKFFQTISPFLPFTYGVDLMREAVGGIVAERVMRDVLFLSLFGVLFLIIGTFLKKLLNKSVKRIMKKSEESGLFH